MTSFVWGTFLGFAVGVIAIMVVVTIVNMREM